MEIIKTLGRPLLLLALLTYGIGLIWHIGFNIFPQKSKELREMTAPAETKPEFVDTPLRAAETEVNRPLPDVDAESRPDIVQTARGRFIQTEPILFNSGSTVLREASIPRLDRIARIIQGNPGMDLHIVGHTDNLGAEEVNRKVSAERAAIVMEYLVSRGVDRSRLTSRGMGSADPIESNDTQLGRQANRRIEFLVEEKQ